MRREIFRSDSRRALGLLARAPAVHLATTTPEGAPVLRALDAAVLDDGLYFHGARAGEKARCVGRPAVVCAEEIVAHLPSWMVHPTHACPASTLYRSVQVRGTLREVSDPATKARALEALMHRWQPEGRYDPIDPSDPFYAGQLEGTLVLAVPFDEVDGKDKLCQNRRPEEIRAILAGLWERGDPGDAEAIEAIRAANPSAPEPPFLAAEGFRLHVAPPEEEAPAAGALLAREGRRSGGPGDRSRRAHRGASAWVGARAPDGALVASARAVSDGTTARVHDVEILPALRGRALRGRLVALLVDHPAVRAAPHVRLRAEDAEEMRALGLAEAGREEARWDGVLLRRPPASR